MTVDLNQLYKDANPGAEVDADATVYFLHRDDRQPTGLESTGWLAI
jgi:hypothetical protein